MKLNKVPSNYRNDLAICIDLATAFSGKQTTFEQFFRAAKLKRIDPEHSSKPFEQLAPGTKRNFENRLARFLGGTKESAEIKKTRQSSVFNIEIAMGNKCYNWTFPIDPRKDLSKQVKQGGQRFTLP